MKSFALKLSVVLALIGLTYILFAQYTGDPKIVPAKTIDPLGELLKEDSAATYAIAAYPDTIRKAVLTICKYPNGILNMEELQKTTQQNFRDLLAPLAKEEQERIWNITRYEGLAERIVKANYKYAEEYGTIASDYPEDVRTDIGKCGTENRSTLISIVSLNRSTDSSFNSIILNYPAESQIAFRSVLNYPELIELLGSSMRMAVKAGDLGKQFPGKLNHQLDSLNIELARQKTKETEDWKNGLDNDPVAKNEFIKATKDYENDHHVYAENTIVNETIIVNYVCTPYSYWYGYPWWYNHSYWYPYPYWYACGYYYGPYGIIFIGYPTPYYTSWYFYHYPHHYHYCHFSDHYINHYYGHRRTPSSSDRVVGNWINEEQPRVSPAFFANNATRADRLKELGRSEIDRADYNTKNPGTAMSRDAFIKSNPSTYPNLSSSNSQRNNVPPPPTKEKEPVRNIPVPPVQKTPDVTPQKPRPQLPQPKQTPPPPVVRPVPKSPPSQSPKPVPKPQPKPQQPSTRPK